MATIRKRGNKYQVQIRRKGTSGVVRTFHTKADADEWARHMEVKADRGDLPIPVRDLNGYKIEDVLKRYRNEITIKKRSANTETYIINAFLRHPIVKLSMAQITASHFCAYRDSRLQEVRAGTVNRELGIIKHAFDLAEQEWDIPIRQNPLAKIKKLKVDNARSRRLTDDEFQTLIKSVKTTRNTLIKPLISFAIETAMRRGEILRIKWEDIDYDRRTLFVPISKNGYSRSVPLTSKAIEILKELKIEDKRDKHRPFPLSDNAAKLAWQRLLKRSGIENFHFHDLRHEAVSRFFERGLSVPEVALISGHRDFRMLFRYTHLRAEDVANKLLQIG